VSLPFFRWPLCAGSVWILKSVESFHLIHLTREIGICLLQTPTSELDGTIVPCNFPLMTWIILNEYMECTVYTIGQFLQIPAHRTDPSCRFQEIEKIGLTNSYICVEQIPSGDGFLKISELGKNSPYTLYSYTGDGQFLQISIHGRDSSHKFLHLVRIFPAFPTHGADSFYKFLKMGRTVPRDVYTWERQFL
jgi:hypothetical protein